MTVRFESSASGAGQDGARCHGLRHDRQEGIGPSSKVHETAVK